MNGKISDKSLLFQQKLDTLHFFAKNNYKLTINNVVIFHLMLIFALKSKVVKRPFDTDRTYSETYSVTTNYKVTFQL